MGERNRLYSRIRDVARETGDTLTSRPHAGPLLAGLLQTPGKLRLEVFERCLDGGRAGGEHEVHMVRDTGQELVESFPQAAPDGIPLNSVTNLLGDR